MSLFMKAALDLARSRQGYCFPNPSVGAVVVQNGMIVGEGCHWNCGEAHAEVVAIQDAAAAAHGADLFVTLVPCHHQGQTPPCTDAIIQGGIARVFYGYEDPGDQVDTLHSLQLLHDAGVYCERLISSDIDMFYQAYRHWCTRKQPRITLKLALSKDGKTAHGDGSPANITGPALQTFTHEQRLRHDGLLTTSKTIVADNPRFNVRLENDTISKPLFVLDSTLETPLDAHIWHTAASVTFFYDPLVASAARLAAFQTRQGTCVPMPVNNDNHLDWSAIMTYTGALGLHSIWIESGGTLASALLCRHAVHDLWLYWGQCVLGSEAKEGLQPSAFAVLQEAESQWQTIGGERVCQMTWGEPCLQD